MSIASANLWTRSVYREYLRPDCSDADEVRQAKLVSLVVNIALAFVLTVVFRTLGVADGLDETEGTDHHAIA